MIAQVFFLNSERALDCLPSGKPLKFVLLEHGPIFAALGSSLRERGSQEIPRADILAQVPDSLVEPYIRAMVDYGDPHDVLWWAHPMSRRLAIRDSLFEAVCWTIALDRYCRTNAATGLVVVTSWVALAEQLKRLSRTGFYQVKNIIERGWSWKEQLKVFPLVLVWSMLRLIYRKWLCARMLPPLSGQQRFPVLVMSNFDGHSFLKCSTRFQDVYWGPLLERALQGQNQVSFLVQVNVSMKKTIQMIRGVGTDRYVPKEAFLAWKDIPKIFVQAMRIAFPWRRPRGKWVMDGHDLGFLFNYFWDRGICSRGVVDCVAMYHSVARAARGGILKKFLFLFENKGIERAAVLALRRTSPQTVLVGYQHAALKPKDLHLSACFAGRERGLLPDRIITTGPAASEQLNKTFCYDRAILVDGCALRRSFMASVLKPRPSECRRLLVILSTDMNEYCETLRFLDLASKDCNRYDIVLRPHPDIDLNQALAIVGPLKLRFRVQGVGYPLEDALKEADVLVYSSSTVPLEALSCGVPLIHLQIAGVLDADTLFDYHGFKWNVDRPDAMIPAIESIWRVPADGFLSRQREAADYVQRYLRGVTEKYLRDIEETEG
ncbi:MAG TPA: hypothetical protein DD723_10500 [Candidatus Omnitrophica bacterium]|nr:MAG: hypothetical protein A2Z81_09850 [Omnitrophica WOR_2 bacterium GWA2_45_18]OGX19880.1 MAG: hypothetical protein A2Y04_02455 [Omnitrophica WOR_2 bacterium GWC2_45_7]HBR15946.1 hypothetical protein [Candidatus Omnitrophota bacterium]